MGEKRHFEPVKRAELRFPENPTSHSSSPARRRQKIAPLRHSSPPPPRPSRSHRHLPTSFAHSVCLIPLPFFPTHPSLADTDPTMSNTTIHHSILFTFPDSSVFYLSLLRGIAAHNASSLLPFLVDPPPKFVQSELWQNTQTAQSRYYSLHLNIFLRTVCRVFLLPQLPCRFAGDTTEAKPPACAQPASHRWSIKIVIMQALTIALLTRHNDIPATESPAPKSAVSEPVTASGADTVLTHAASAVYRHHHDADQARTAAFTHLTCANAPLFPPCKHNYMAECARFLPLRMRLLL